MKQTNFKNIYKYFSTNCIHNKTRTHIYKITLSKIKNRLKRLYFVTPLKLARLIRQMNRSNFDDPSSME